MTVVTIDNDLYGSIEAVAIEIRENELLVEMGYLPPVGTMMKVSIEGVAWSNAVVTGSFEGEGYRRVVRFDLRDAIASEAAAVH